jgi:hypothetical protein
VIDADDQVPLPFALMPLTPHVKVVPGGSASAGVVHVPPELQPRVDVVYVVFMTPAM